MGPGYPDPRYARHLSTPQASITKEVWTHGGIVGRKGLGPLMGMGGSNGDPFLSLSLPPILSLRAHFPLPPPFVFSGTPRQALGNAA